MKIYSKNNNYTLYHGNCLDMLDALEENSIDSIVTDPPYELNFMGKGWDNAGISFQPDTWKKCYEVLKPGGYLLAFGGSRTFHRIACAIEDAGFEIRDTIMWLYGCLSSDTEILTPNGWKKYGEIKENDEIYSLDLQKNVLIKNKCKHIFKYNYDGDMINLKNNNTDQLLTPNHHVIVKDVIRTRAKGNATNYTKHDYWQYKDAWQIRSEQTTLPLASVYNGGIEIGNLASELMGLILADGFYHTNTNAISLYQTNYNKEMVKRIRYILGKLNLEYSEYKRERAYDDKNIKHLLKEEKHGKTYIEHQFYLGEKCGWFVNKIKELCPNKKLNWNLLELSSSNKEYLIKGLCEGDGGKAPVKFGYDAFYQKDIHELEIFQVLLHMTNKQGWINEKHSSCSIHLNPTTELQGKHFANRFVDNYTGGYVWCIETEVGNFMARRNGKVFITGNSGFPKSLNIGLAIDKKNGVKSEVIGYEKTTMPDFRDVGKKQKEISGIDKLTFGQIENSERKQQPIYKAQNEWGGWGTALKPAYEPIIVARKPLDGTVAKNCLKWGVGGINIDECRIGNETISIHNAPKGTFAGGEYDRGSDTSSYRDCTGRFPANVILTYDETDKEEVCGGFPNTKGTKVKEKGSYGFCFSDKERDSKPMADGHNDEGSAARYFKNCSYTEEDFEDYRRYFYSAKASKKDRDEGLDEFEEQQMYDGKNAQFGYGNTKDDNFGDRVANVKRKNIHPTVKPTELMRYLIRMVTPKGGTVLDPFNGSGSTGKATMLENTENNKDYKYIGIELTEEYLPIAKARIEYAQNKKPNMQTKK